MVYNIGINSCLKTLVDEKKLKIGHQYVFEKTGERLYPLRVPIELINDAWEIIGKVLIREITIGNGKTTGKYELLKIYDKNARKIFTENVIKYSEVK